MRRLLSTILFLHIIIGSAWALATEFRVISTVPPTHAEGYRCIFFDCNGLLWIGSDAGLKRYDGYNMMSYNSNAYSPRLLPNNNILCITEDSHHRLWLGTRNGLVCFDKRWNTFKTYTMPEENQRIIYSLFTDSRGTVWIGTDGGLSYFDENADAIVSYRPEEITMHYPDGKRTKGGAYSVKSMAEDHEGNIYIGTWSSGLMRFKPGSRDFYLYPKRNHLNSAFALTFDSRGRLWIGTWGHGIERLDDPLNPQSDKVKRWKYPNLTNNFYKLVEDKANKTMMAVCREGVSFICTVSDEDRLAKLPELTNKHISQSNDIALADNGNIWISTVGDGVIQLTSKPSPFKLHSIHGTESSVLTMFTSDGNNMWIGLQPSGLIKYDTTNNRILGEDHLSNINGSDPLFAKSTINDIIRTANGELWLASGGHGIMQVAANGQCKSMVSNNSPFIGDNYVTALYQATDGTIWIGQRNKLGVRNISGKGKSLTMKEGNDDFSTCDVRAISEDKNKNIWVATDNEGIIKITNRGGQFVFHHYCLNNGRLPVEDVLKCHQDSFGNIWAITNSGGLLKLDENDDVFYPVNRKYKIDGYKVFSINEDHHGCLWLSTERSLVRLAFSGADLPTVTSFSKDGDNEGYEFCPNSTFRLGNTLYFGGKGGFVSFNPDEIKEDNRQDIERLIVSDIVVGGKNYNDIEQKARTAISEESPMFTRKIVIPASVERFSIEFSLLTYTNIMQNKYAYKLESDNYWHHVDASTRRASFEGLPSGTYKLRIKAANSYGTWTELPYKIEIHVLPPWYLSWWALLIYIAMGIVSVWFIIIWYKEYLKTKNRLQMAVVFTNITHELLTPLTIISSSIEEIKRKAPQFEEGYTAIDYNIGRLTRLLRQILEVRKQQAGQLKLQVSKGNLSEFVETECRNIMPLASRKSQHIEMHIDPTLTDVYFDKDKLDKMIYNLLSNALKYNKENGKVTVTLCRNGDKLNLSVEDEGIGISKDKMRRLYTRFLDGDYRKMNVNGTGIGLSLTRDLVHLHHGTIDCKSNEGSGTKFTIELPIDNHSYNEDEIVALTADEEAVKTVRKEHPEEPLPEMAFNEENNKDYTILVVEDNIDLLELMARLLGKKYNVMTAKNGQQAWNIIQRSELDIVITDVMMPVMDGIELTRIVKESEGYAQLPIVMLTAKTRDEDRIVAFETGADEYIAKPFKLSELEVRIDNIIRNRQLIRQRFSSQTEFNVEDQHYSNPDEVFLNKAIECVKANINEYDRESFARDMCLSSSSLYNKLRAITGQNISSFIASVRLKEACRIARQEPNIKVIELGMRVGFSTPKYFTKVFKEEFGMAPSEYLEKLKRDEQQ